MLFRSRTMISVLECMLANTSSRLFWLSSASPEDAGHSSTSLAFEAFELATYVSTNTGARSRSAAKRVAIRNCECPTAHSNSIQTQPTLPNNFGIFCKIWKSTVNNAQLFLNKSITIISGTILNNCKQYSQIYCEIL